MEAVINSRIRKKDKMTGEGERRGGCVCKSVSEVCVESMSALLYVGKGDEEKD